VSRPIRTREQWESDFWAKVQKTDGGCMVWTGSKCTKGYGRICLHDGERHRYFLAHRIAFALRHGFDALPEWRGTPETLTIDHVCRNRSCVNVDHLRLLTLAENSRNTASAEKTACKRGHALVDENTYVSREGHRSCKVCRRAATRRWNAAA
jgi:HNH endonuclease